MSILPSEAIEINDADNMALPNVIGLDIDWEYPKSRAPFCLKAEGRGTLKIS